MSEKVSCTSCGAKILPTTFSKNNGICMRCKKEGPPRLSATVKAASESPASFLSDFNSTLVTVNARESTVLYNVGCTCGNSNYKVLGYPMDSPSYAGVKIFAAPISLACCECNVQKQLFDPNSHGYDGELGESAGVTGSGSPSEFICSNCNKREFNVSVELIYSISDEEMEGWDELSDSPQNFFTSIDISGTCYSCDARTSITNYECA